MEIPFKDCNVNQAANFLINISMTKIKIGVAFLYPKFALSMRGKRDITAACLNYFFNSPKNSTLKSAVVLSKYYNNGSYLPLVNKLTNAS